MCWSAAIARGVTARKPDEVKDLAVTGGRTMINEADELDDADTADLFTEIPCGIDK